MNDVTSQPETIKKLTISNLYDKSLIEDGNYLIVKCDDPNCIYKLFTETDNKMDIQVFISRDYNRTSSFLSSYARKVDGTLSIVHDSDNAWWRNNSKKINVIVEHPEKISARMDSSGYKNITIDGLKISLQLDNTTKFPVVEKEDGKFYIRVFNHDFKLYVDSTRYGGIIASTLNIIANSDAAFADRGQQNRFMKMALEQVSTALPTKTEGITKSLSKIMDFWKNESDPISKIAFLWLVNDSSKTISNVKMSVIFNKLFENVSTQKEFSDKTFEMSKLLLDTKWYYDGKQYLERLLDMLPDARDIKKAALKRKSTGAFNKIMDDLDFVDIDIVKYPLTHEAVHSGELPIGTFFRKSGESYFMFNDNWELWEEMLASHPEEAKQLAATCSGRTTYEKDLMSYFYFVLHKLPEYLQIQTGNMWKCIPKLVNSSNELDPPKEGENGVAKTRSALTPIVDNDKHEVVVPYVSMSISGGYGTTYCYGLNYEVLERGVSWLGNTITKNVESKLNGRDDYGLMFYTLTGTAQGRGYPTFLIIFEKLESKTKVHFHRVHPTRSKNGDYNAIHNWTIGCYKWMIGNVNFERIKAQQGDLAFVEIDKFPDGEVTKVDSYDNHKFGIPVDFTPYIKKEKQNILGYVKLENDTTLNHNEHMNRIIPAGNYEIRQCRSWEANPKGVWSLRID